MNSDFEYIIDMCRSKDNLRGLDYEIYKNNGTKTFGIMLGDLNTLELEQLIRKPQFSNHKKNKNEMRNMIAANNNNNTDDTRKTQKATGLQDIGARSTAWKQKKSMSKDSAKAKHEKPSNLSTTMKRSKSIER